jgi:hypothetical protein
MGRSEQGAAAKLLPLVYAELRRWRPRAWRRKCQAKRFNQRLWCIGQARKIIESGFDDGIKHARWDRGLWFDWVFARVLLYEASELLQTKPDSTRAGGP